MTPEELIARATDPRQYDERGMDWPRQGPSGIAAARYYRDRLAAALEGAPVREALDIGCGTGHLEPFLRSLGARRVVGVEPSARNAEAARRLFPRLEVIEASLGEVTLPATFDLAVAVMSFEHQPDLGAALRRVRDLLVPGGRFALVTGDPAFHLAPRFGLRIESHALADGTLAIATHYPFGTIHDLIRSPELVLAAADAAGFARERRSALPATAELFEHDPRWHEVEGLAIGHLFVLKKP